LHALEQSIDRAEQYLIVLLPGRADRAFDAFGER